jgi:hypothetical protein
MRTALSTRVIARCDQDALEANHDLRKLADAFDAASEFEAMKAENGAKKMLGAWARLRQAWFKYSGEPLL